jgi:hypothetical protein
MPSTHFVLDQGCGLAITARSAPAWRLSSPSCYALMDGDLLLGILGISVVLLATAWLVVVVGLRTGVIIPTLVSYFGHIGIAVTTFLTLGLWAPDAYFYDDEAQQLASFWAGHAATGPSLAPGKEAWPYALAGLYSAFGHFPVAGLIVNAAACALLVSVAAATVRRLGGPVRAAAWLTTLLPPFLFWGSLLLREALAWLALSLVMYALVGILKPITARRDWIVFFAALTALLSLRGSVAFIIGGASVLAATLVGRRGWAVAAMAVAITLALAGPVANQFSAIIGGVDFQQLNASRLALSATAATSGFGVTAYGNLGSVVSALPALVPRVLFGPFPWEWPAVGLAFAGDAIVWLCLLGLSWRGWRATPDRRRMMLVIIPAAALLLVLALTSGNYGTLQRLRAEVEVILIPLASMGLDRFGTMDSRKASLKPAVSNLEGHALRSTS